MSLLEKLITSLCCLPSVGKKSAQRMAMYLLEYDRQGANNLAEDLINAMQNIGNCAYCKNFTENDLCNICSNPKRSDDLICIVETPMDLIAIEQSANFSGKYFVLMGHLSPIDGISAKDLGLDKFAERLKKSKPKEIIIATNSTIEGEVTAEYIKNIAKNLGILVTRIAQGVPLGGELGFVDQETINHAISGRTPLSNY